MKRLASMFCLLLTPLLFAHASVQAQDAVTFRYKMNKDDKLIYRNVSDVKQTQKVSGQEVKTTITSKQIDVRTFDSVDEKGNFTIQSENEQLYVKMSIGPLGDYVFDSKSSENEKGSTLGGALTPVYERLLGASVKITHTPRGKVTKVDGLEGLLDDVLKDNPIGQQFASGATEEGATLEFGQTFVEFPEEPVKPGDTWEVPFEIKLPKIGTFKGKKIYTYEGTDKVGSRKTAKLSVTTELSIKIDIDMDGANVTGSLSVSESSGTVHFDPEKGQIVSNKYKMTLAGNLNVSVNGMDIPIEQSQTQTVTTELLEKLPE